MAKRTVLSVLKEMIGVDAAGRKRDGSGDYILRKGYFYRHGMDSAKMAARVEEELPKLGLHGTVIEHGDHWAAFRGGASIAQSSHFWVRVHIDGTAIKANPNSSLPPLQAIGYSEQ